MGLFDIPVSISGNASAANIKKRTGFSKDRIIGMPLKFNNVSDPFARVYSNTLIRDAPVVNITPGVPRFLGLEEDGNVSDEAMRDLVSQIAGVKDSDTDSIRNFLTNGNGKGPGDIDMRYYSFSPAFKDYYSYVDQMVNAVGTRMLGLSKDMMFSFSDLVGDDGFSSIFSMPAMSFYFDKSTSVSESASNSFGSSQLEGTLKSGSQIKRELDFLMGKNVDVNQLVDGGADSNATSMIDNIVGVLDSITAKGGVDKFQTILNGSNLLFPEIWQDSQFTKSYSISFEFYSPYGNPLSIFRNVYVPFLSLLCLTLPRQDTYMGYNSPFIVKLESIGHFSIPMGVITSLDFTKGGDDNSFSVDGLPTSIKVNLQVKDLYPAIMMSKSYSVLASNTGLGDFLSNMAGVSSSQVDLAGDISAYISGRVRRLVNIDDTASAWLGDKMGNVVNYLNNVIAR